MDGMMNQRIPLARVTGVVEEITAAEYGGQAKIDKASGLQLWKVGICARLEGVPRRVPAEVLVASAEPPSIALESDVLLENPTATFWALRNGKCGVTLRATALLPLPATGTEVPAQAPARAGLPLKPEAAK